MNIAVIFAGGIGTRMNSKALPKQFIKLYGKEIIIYTLEQFEYHSKIDKIVIACVAEWLDFLKGLIKKYNLQKVVEIVPGGQTGQDSIYNGLKAAERESKGIKSTVLVHDGVRPLIDYETITKCIESVNKNGNGITVSPAIETIIRDDGNNHIDKIIKRSDCMMARAPQCFKLDELISAHEQARSEDMHDFIDSATLMKHYGYELFTVIGRPENIKITTPMDYYTFKGMVEARENSQLFGI